VPNPFNPSTRLEYELARAGRVRLRIFDVGGRLVREVDVGHRPAGLSSIPWDGRDSRGRTLGSGVYVVRLEAGNGTSHLRVTMTK
jgi:flagellar hook assembly protein FlgD